jgi:hypothetical protein
MLILAEGRLSTLSSRSVFYKAVVRRISSTSDCREQRDSRNRLITGSPRPRAAAPIAGW